VHCHQQKGYYNNCLMQYTLHANSSKHQVVISHIGHRSEVVQQEFRVSSSSLGGKTRSFCFCKLVWAATLKIFSSVKNMKSTTEAGKRCKSFFAQIRRDAQFAAVSSCARRFFGHFNLRSWRTMRYTDEWWMPVSLAIWRVNRWVFVAPSWLKTNSSTESTLSSMRALRRRPLPARRAVVPVSRNFFNMCLH